MPLVPNKTAYLSNNFQHFWHSLCRQIPLFVSSHNHRWFLYILGIIRIRYSPGSKQVMPSHICILTNLTSPASVCRIWIPIIVLRVIDQVWLNHWSETLHINPKHVIARLRSIVNNAQIFILWRRILTHLW